jgi:membrane protease YdiL (CAAX protease family)
VGSILILLIAATIIRLTHYAFIPWYVARTGQPYLVAYLWGWGSNMVLVSAIALIAYRLERRPFTWGAFAARLRLDRMPWQDWLWALAVLVGVAGIYLALSFTAPWLAQVPGFAPHPIAPPEVGPDGMSRLDPGQFFGMALAGKWWVAGVYFAGWVLNILGEELFYRGWLLPRQEAAFGRWAWVVNGTIFTLQHTLQAWNYFAIWPGALFMAYVVQRRRNTWIGIIQHGIMNLGLFLVVLRGVIG